MLYFRNNNKSKKRIWLSTYLADENEFVLMNVVSSNPYFPRAFSDNGMGLRSYCTHTSGGIVDFPAHKTRPLCRIVIFDLVTD